MSLQVGVRLGPYEVSGTLGAGGMGEVYRARDTRLKRDVALIRAPTGEGAAAQVIVVQHWFEELKRLVPVK